jgi:hypothetical protein
MNNEEQCAQSQSRPSEGHRTVNSACPVPHEYKAPTVETVRTLTVGCAHRQQPSLTVELVVEGYKYPQPPPLQSSKHSSHSIQYKSKTQHSKTQIKAFDPIKVPNSILVFRYCERIVLVFLCCSCCLVAFCNIQNRMVVF